MDYMEHSCTLNYLEHIHSDYMEHTYTLTTWNIHTYIVRVHTYYMEHTDHT